MADPSTSPPLTRASVIEAHKLIKPFVHHTPTITNATLTQLASTPRDDGGGGSSSSSSNPTIRLYFKCENLQRVGAFKARGAFHAVERLCRDEAWVKGGGRERGVVTHSSGNHAQALALAARDHGIPAHIVMPTISAAPKIAATRGYGARVVFSGSTSAEREAVAASVIEETGARLVPPYDHPDIVLGQGTVGLELLEDAADLIHHHAGSAGAGKCSFAATGAGGGEREEGKGKGKKNGRLDAILAPCGGGGLLAGVALACDGTGTRVFGCEPSFEGADDGGRGYAAGARVPAVSSRTVADGLRTPLGAVPWGVIYERRLVAGFYSAGEAQIAAALRLLLERAKLVVEPSAAVPLAVALYNEEFRARVQREAGGAGWDVGVVLSGGNVSVETLGKLFAPSE